VPRCLGRSRRVPHSQGRVWRVKGFLSQDVRNHFGHWRFRTWLLIQRRKGDYHRYLAEFASGNKRKVAATAAHEAYKVSSSCSIVSFLLLTISERYRCRTDWAHSYPPHPPWSRP
jgi:hypothetical protein